MNSKSTAILERLKGNAKERQEKRKSFSLRNYALWIFSSWIGYPIAVILSVLTMGANFYYSWANAIPFDSLRWLAIVLVVAFVEGIIFYTVKGFVDDIQAGALSGTKHDKIMLTLKLIIGAGALYFSISQSLEGAPYLYEQVKRNHTPLEELLLDEAQADATYQAQRDQQLAMISSARNTTWRGRMTQDAMKSMRAAQQELSAIDAQIAEEKSRIRGKNAAIQLEYEAEVQRSADRAYGIAGVGAVAGFIFLLIIGIYDDGTECELSNSAAGGKSSIPPAPPSISGGPRGAGILRPAAPPPPPIITKTENPLPKARRPIGFFRFRDDPSTPAPGATPLKGTARTKAVPDGPARVDALLAATHSDSPAAPDPTSIEAITRLNSWRRFSSDRSSYKNRPDTTAKKAATERLTNNMKIEEQALAQLGLRIELQESPRRKWILVPLES